jgi:ABC-type sulfate/molybdate transport systems ATPase subunit
MMTVASRESGFDPGAVKVLEDLRAWLRRLHDEVHVTTVLVTHDQAEALDVADRIAVLNTGRIEQVGSPAEVYDTPANPFVMSFSAQCHRRTASWCVRTTFGSAASQI